MRLSRLESPSRLFGAKSDSVEPRLAQRVPRRTPASFREIFGFFRRVHLEVHAQWIRLQHPRQHSDYVSGGMAEVQDPWICWPRSVPNFHGFSALMVFSSVA